MSKRSRRDKGDDSDDDDNNQSKSKKPRTDSKKKKNVTDKKKKKSRDEDSLSLAKASTKHDRNSSKKSTSKEEGTKLKKKKKATQSDGDDDDNDNGRDEDEDNDSKKEATNKSRRVRQSLGVSDDDLSQTAGKILSKKLLPPMKTPNGKSDGKSGGKSDVGVKKKMKKNKPAVEPKAVEPKENRIPRRPAPPPTPPPTQPPPSQASPPVVGPPIGETKNAFVSVSGGGSVPIPSIAISTPVVANRVQKPVVAPTISAATAAVYRAPPPRIDSDEIRAYYAGSELNKMSESERKHQMTMRKNYVDAILGIDSKQGDLPSHRRLYDKYINKDSLPFHAQPHSMDPRSADKVARSAFSTMNTSQHLSASETKAFSASARDNTTSHEFCILPKTEGVFAALFFYDGHAYYVSRVFVFSRLATTDQHGTILDSGMWEIAKTLAPTVEKPTILYAEYAQNNSPLPMKIEVEIQHEPIKKYRQQLLSNLDGLPKDAVDIFRRKIIEPNLAKTDLLSSIPSPASGTTSIIGGSTTRESSVDEEGIAPFVGIVSNADNTTQVANDDDKPILRMIEIPNSPGTHWFRIFDILVDRGISFVSTCDSDGAEAASRNGITSGGGPKSTKQHESYLLSNNAKYTMVYRDRYDRLTKLYRQVIGFHVNNMKMPISLKRASILTNESLRQILSRCHRIVPLSHDTLAAIKETDMHVAAFNRFFKRHKRARDDRSSNATDSKIESHRHLLLDTPIIGGGVVVDKPTTTDDWASEALQPDFEIISTERKFKSGGADLLDCLVGAPGKYVYDDSLNGDVREHIDGVIIQPWNTIQEYPTYKLKLPCTEFIDVGVGIRSGQNLEAMEPLSETPNDPLRRLSTERKIILCLYSRSGELVFQEEIEPTHANMARWGYQWTRLPGSGQSFGDGYYRPAIGGGGRSLTSASVPVGATPTANGYWSIISETTSVLKGVVHPTVECHVTMLGTDAGIKFTPMLIRRDTHPNTTMTIMATIASIANRAIYNSVSVGEVPSPGMHLLSLVANYRYSILAISHEK